MSSSLDTGTVAKFLRALNELGSARLAQTIASYAAPVLTRVGLQDFDAQKAPSGVPWAPSAEGKTVDLVRTGSLRGNVRYVAVGRILRVALGVRYARYQIGKRPIFPARGLALPDAYRAALHDATDRATREFSVANGLDVRD